jgi:AGCS family alanine or glycine:cation symporter
VGAVAELKIVWNVSDIMNGLMAFPNLIGIVGLAGVLVAEKRHYFETGGPQRIHSSRDTEEVEP